MDNRLSVQKDEKKTQNFNRKYDKILYNIINSIPTDAERNDIYAEIDFCDRR